MGRIVTRETCILTTLTGVTTAVAWYMTQEGAASAWEAGAFVTGAVCVWLTVKESVWNFPISLINVAVFFVVFVGSKLYADAGLQVVYFALTCIGWWMWCFGGAAGAPLRISRVPRGEARLLAILAVLFTVGMSLYLRHVGGSVPVADAGTTAISLVAQWLLNRKYLETWWCWIAADVIYIPVYAYKELYLTSGLYFVFLIMATMGLLAWRAAWQESMSNEDSPCSASP
jgi:nicotinamide mononucleotide transporter